MLFNDCSEFGKRYRNRKAKQEKRPYRGRKNNRIQKNVDTIFYT
jgi:hypothetical protein